jgi:hypothetical protein
MNVGLTDDDAVKFAVQYRHLAQLFNHPQPKVPIYAEVDVLTDP